jgi:hypothetical protein
MIDKKATVVGFVDYSKLKIDFHGQACFSALRVHNGVKYWFESKRDSWLALAAGITR